jgi:hypothetical protein
VRARKISIIQISTISMEKPLMTLLKLREEHVERRGEELGAMYLPYLIFGSSRCVKYPISDARADARVIVLSTFDTTVSYACTREEVCTRKRGV